MNHVTLIGRVGKDAEVKNFDGGGSVAHFSLATTERWKDKEGEKKEQTTWHSIIFSGSVTASIEKYVKKGMLLCVTGRICHRDYERDGIKRTVTEIRGDRFEFLSKSEARAEGEPSYEQPLRGPTDDLPF
jgi:single-strand DNA-binding protein